MAGWVFCSPYFATRTRIFTMRVSPEELYSIYLKHRLITTDSRQIPIGSIFFALKGDNFDGNIFAEASIDKGAFCAVIDNPEYESEKCLLVDDVLHSLQRLAALHRAKLNIPVIGITGSNGKTTTKELLNAVLGSHFKVLATKGNLNNHIGVPVTLLEIADDTQISIIEMGANHQGEIENLCGIAKPTHGLITNIGKAHLGGFGGFEGIVKAKNELYSWLKTSNGHAFVNADNPLLVKLSEGIKQKTFYSATPGFHTYGKVAEESEFLVIDWHTGNQTVRIRTKLIGNYNFENVMAAICIGSFFGIPVKKIADSIGNYTPSNSRSQFVKTARNTIILDAYNANPSSMVAAIENFKRINSPLKMLILGDMLELGDKSLSEHKAIVRMLVESDFDKVILVGPDFSRTASSGFIIFASSEDARLWLSDQKIENHTILVKGSRGIKMEKVLDTL